MSTVLEGSTSKPSSTGESRTSITGQFRWLWTKATKPKKGGGIVNVHYWFGYVAGALVGLILLRFVILPLL